MGGTLGHAVFELAEKGLQKLGTSHATVEPFTEGVQNFMHSAFGLESQATGKSGTALIQDLQEFNKLFSFKESEYTQLYKGVASPHEIRGLARRDARGSKFGSNDTLLVQHLANIAHEHGEEKAKNIADSLGVFFHDTPKVNASGGETSKLTSALRRDPLTKNIKDWRNSPYKPPTEAERNIRQFTNATLAFKAGLAHLSTPLNGLIGQSLTSFGKATQHIFGSGFQNIKAEIESNNALGSMLMEEYQQIFNHKNGVIGKFAPGSIGKFISDNWMIPGMSFVRQKSMVFLAAQGKYSAMESAAVLANVKSSARKIALAQENLRYHGINPLNVIRNNGQLGTAEIASAMYENVNKRMFVESGLNRSRFANSTVIGRSLALYHNYAAAQANFLQKEFMRNVHRGDPVRAVKDFAILGTILPAVGTGIYGIERGIMGKGDLDETTDSISSVLSPNGITDAESWMNRVEGISHVAGLGVLNSYVRAAGRRKLLESIAGPQINAAGELGQDIIVGIEGNAQDEHNFEPVARDILHDIPSYGLGAQAAEAWFPKEK